MSNQACSCDFRFYESESIESDTFSIPKNKRNRYLTRAGGAPKTVDFNETWQNYWHIGYSQFVYRLNSVLARERQSLPFYTGISWHGCCTIACCTLALAWVAYIQSVFFMGISPPLCIWRKSEFGLKDWNTTCDIRLKEEDVCVSIPSSWRSDIRLFCGRGRGFLGDSSGTVIQIKRSPVVFISCVRLIGRPLNGVSGGSKRRWCCLFLGRDSSARVHRYYYWNDRRANQRLFRRMTYCRSALAMSDVCDVTGKRAVCIQSWPSGFHTLSKFKACNPYVWKTVHSRVKMITCMHGRAVHVSK